MSTDSVCSRLPVVSAYKESLENLIYYFISSGLKFVFNTDNESSQNEIRELLSNLYSQGIKRRQCFPAGPLTVDIAVYVEYAAKSPMLVPGEMITSNLFR